MTLNEFATILGTTLSEGVIYVFQHGGNAGLAILASFGLIAVFISSIQNLGKLLGQLFIVFIALPLILIEEYKKWRSIRK